MPPMFRGALAPAEIMRVKNNDPRLVEIAVGDILIDADTTAKLAEALKSNTKLQRIEFREEYNYCQDHLYIILDALAQSNIRKISVDPQSRILHDDGTYAILISKRISSIPSLIVLDLGECHFGPSVAIKLSTILATNTSLKRLVLSNNRISDGGAAAMSHMLRHNTALEEMVLDDNNISAYGQRALRNAIYDDSSFTGMESCNHVLQSYFENPRKVFGPAVMNDVLSSHAANLRSKSAKSAITKKLKRVLQKKYRVRLQFDTFLNVDSNAMPCVLGWIAEKCDLDLMYSFKPILLNLLESVEKDDPKEAQSEATC